MIMLSFCLKSCDCRLCIWLCIHQQILLGPSADSWQRQSRSFFIAESFQHEERIGQRNQGDMMIHALPGAAFKMIHHQLCFHLPVILFNPVTTFCFSDQIPPRSMMGIQIGEPEFQGLLTPLRPFNKQLLRRYFHGFPLN